MISLSILILLNVVNKVVARIPEVDAFLLLLTSLTF